MDQAEFYLTMATLGWSTAAVQGFEEVAFGAALTLIHYQDGLTSQGRMTWANANHRASHIGQKGIQKTRQGSYLTYLNGLRMQTFGLAYDDHSVSHQPILATTPWAHTDAQFQFCMNYINTGQFPDDEKFKDQIFSKDQQLVSDQVQKSLTKEALKYFELGVALYGGKFLSGLLELKKLTLVGLGLDIIKMLVVAAVDEFTKQQVVERFKTDEGRRKYLAGVGRSTYRAVC